MVEKYQFAVRKYLLNDNDLLHFCIFNIDFPVESQRSIHVKSHQFFYELHTYNIYQALLNYRIVINLTDLTTRLQGYKVSAQMI